MVAKPFGTLRAPPLRPNSTAAAFFLAMVKIITETANWHQLPLIDNCYRLLLSFKQGAEMAWNMPDGATQEQADRWNGGYDEQPEENEIEPCVICQVNDRHDASGVCGSCEDAAQQRSNAQ